MPSDADLPDDVRIHVEANRPVDQRPVGAGRREIEEDPLGIRDAFLVERNFAIDFDRDAHGIGEDRAADIPDGCDPGRPRLSAGRRARLGRPAAGFLETGKLAGNLPDEPARRIGSLEPLQQLDTPVPVPGLAESLEGVEQEAARLPQCVVAVGAGWITPHD
jgi:hypothetical protein